jgi:uncharacterized membrane protein
MVTDIKSIVQHITLGAIAGAVIYLGLASQSPGTIGTPLTYLTTISAGYLAIDALTQLFGVKPTSNSSSLNDGIPLSG